jgi:hypothetical protein
MRDEDDLRAALRTLERHTPDPDLMLATIQACGRAAAPPRPGRRSHGPAGRAARWSRRIAPLAVAVAVLATIAAAGLVAKVVASGPNGTGGSHRVSTAAPPFPTWDGLPAYFLSDRGPFEGAEPNGGNVGGSPASRLPRAQDLPIIATSTGQAVASVRLPGYVAAISASAGAFFAAVVKDHAASFYEIRLAHAGTRATATKLPIPADTAPIGFMAASPDGSKLAISTYVQHGAAMDIRNLVVAATSTGAERRWRTPGREARESMGTMAWVGGGRTLAINWTGRAAVSPSTGLRLLDTSPPGNNALTGAPILRGHNSAGFFDDYTISSDGKMLLGVVACLPGCGQGSLGTVQGHPDLLGSLIGFAATAMAPTVRYAEPELPGVASRSGNSGCIDPMWLSASGQKILLPCFQHRPATRRHKAVTITHVLLLDHGKATALPWLNGFVNDEAAFPGTTFLGGGWVSPPPGFPYPSS